MPEPTVKKLIEWIQYVLWDCKGEASLTVELGDFLDRRAWPASTPLDKRHVLICLAEALLEKVREKSDLA